MAHSCLYSLVMLERVQKTVEWISIEERVYQPETEFGDDPLLIQ